MKKALKLLLIIILGSLDIFCILLITELIVSYLEPYSGPQDTYSNIVDDKPVIYLYDYNGKVNVQLILKKNTKFTCVYPEYKEDGWTVSAKPDGHLTDENGNVYRYLYYETDTPNYEWDMSKGFCVKGEDTAEFLQSSLKKIGLIDDEINEFIIYWLPQMQNNKYNVISFKLTDEINDVAELKVTPEPETLIRVIMAWYPSEEKVELPEQTFTTPERIGKTVVEWGGSQIEN